MKNRGQTYWQTKAKLFLDHYTSHNPIWKHTVGSFLNRRTTILMQFTDEVNKANILDVGCGNGVHMKLLFSKAKHITGIDYSSQMIAFAKRELTGYSQRKWKIMLSDAHKLPFSKETFDCIIAMGLFDYVQSPMQVLSECHRVLKKGGVLVFTIPKKPSLFGFMRTSWGIRIKKLAFHLPAVGNIVSKNQLIDFVSSKNFRIQRVISIWTTMWMVKAVKL